MYLGICINIYYYIFNKNCAISLKENKKIYGRVWRTEETRGMM